MLDRMTLSNEPAFTSSAAPPRLCGSPDELKAVVRDGLIAMEQPEREQMIRDLEREMSRSGFNLCSHLVLIGIPAASPSEMTPNEVGHLVRFISMTAPRLTPAVERVLARHIACWRDEEPLRPAA